VGAFGGLNTRSDLSWSYSLNQHIAGNVRVTSEPETSTTAASAVELHLGRRPALQPSNSMALSRANRFLWQHMLSLAAVFRLLSRLLQFIQADGGPERTRRRNPRHGINPEVHERCALIRPPNFDLQSQPQLSAPICPRLTRSSDPARGLWINIFSRSERRVGLSGGVRLEFPFITLQCSTDVAAAPPKEQHRLNSTYWNGIQMCCVRA